MHPRLQTPLRDFCQAPRHTLEQPIPASGFNGEQLDAADAVWTVNLHIDRRVLLKTPLLQLDIGRHDLILGRKWFEYHDVSLDVRRRRLGWPEDTPPLRDFPSTIVRRAEDLLAPDEIDLEHQLDAERRQKAFEANAMAYDKKMASRPVKILKRPEPPSRTQREDAAESMDKMERALQGKTIQYEERRLPRPRDPAPFKATPIKPAPNLIINALSFKRQMGHEATEVGVISLYELDKLIDSKKAEKRAAEDPLYDDTEETRRLIREKLPLELQPWADVFSKAASDKLAPHRPYDHKIELTEGGQDRLRYSPLYKQSLEELEATREYLKDNLDKGFITASDAPWASPTLFVRKHDGSLRFCVDYRRLNAETKKDQYPLPLIENTLARLCKAKIYTKLDIRQAFHRIRIAEGHEDLTTFKTQLGAYKYLVLPFGLCNGPSTYQRYMNKVLMEYLDDFCTAYMDDILIYSDDPAEHHEHVTKVLDRLREAGLQADIKKCEFSVTQTKYLGFIVSTEGLQPDPEKVEVIRTWQPPKNVKGVQSFLGFCNFYRRFVRDYGKMARPLNRLTVKGVEYKWTSDCEEGFESLKAALSSAPILRYWNPDLPTRVETDASISVCAGALLQQQPDDDLWHPVAFFSKTMSPAEMNYPIHDREMLAIILALEEWRAELTSVSQRFDVITDHQALLFFMTKRLLNTRQARWTGLLSNYNFAIQYRPGRENVLADALSRKAEDLHTQKDIKDASRTQVMLKPSMLSPEVLEELRQMLTAASATPELTVGALEPTSELQGWLLVERILQLNRDPETPSLKACRALVGKDSGHWTVKEGEGLLLMDGRVVVPAEENLRTRIIQEVHGQQPLAHPGRNKTAKIIKGQYYWQGLTGDVEQYIRNCHTCRRAQKPRDATPGELRPLPIPIRPWQFIAMDFMALPKDRHGFDAVWVVICRLSKRPVSVPCHKTVTARDMAWMFFRYVFPYFGFPDEIVSDRGAQFISGFWNELCKIAGVRISLSTAGHPQTDGQTEVMNQYLQQRLRVLVNEYADNWSDLLPAADFAQACLPSEATGLSPFEIEQGRKPRMSYDWSKRTTKFDDTRDKLNRKDAQAMISQIHDAWRIASGQMAVAQRRYTRAANRSRRPDDLAVGDLVWVSTKGWRSPTQSKLSMPWDGPYKIKAAGLGGTWVVDLPPSRRVHNTFNPSRLRKASDDPLPGQRATPPPPIEYTDGPEFEVDKVIQSRIYRRKLQYRVDWLGYDKDPEWYDAEAFKHAPAALQAFHDAHPAAEGPPKNLRLWLDAAAADEEPPARDDDNAAAEA